MTGEVQFQIACQSRSRARCAGCSFPLTQLLPLSRSLSLLLSLRALISSSMLVSFVSPSCPPLSPALDVFFVTLGASCSLAWTRLTNATGSSPALPPSSSLLSRPSTPPPRVSLDPTHALTRPPPDATRSCPPPPLAGSRHGKRRHAQEGQSSLLLLFDHSALSWWSLENTLADASPSLQVLEGTRRPSPTPLRLLSPSPSFEHTMVDSTRSTRWDAHSCALPLAPAAVKELVTDANFDCSDDGIVRPNPLRPFGYTPPSPADPVSAPFRNSKRWTTRTSPSSRSASTAPGSNPTAATATCTLLTFPLAQLPSAAPSRVATPRRAAR